MGLSGKNFKPLWIGDAFGGNEGIPLIRHHFIYITFYGGVEKVDLRTLEVVSYMKEGRLFIDGANLVVPFRTGDRLKVQTSRQPLKVIGLKN